MSFKEKLKDFVKKYHYTKKETDSIISNLEETISNITSPDIGTADELQNLINNNDIVILEKDYVINNTDLYIGSNTKKIIGNGHTISLNGYHNILARSRQQIKCIIQDLTIIGDDEYDYMIQCNNCEITLDNVKISAKYGIMIDSRGDSTNYVNIINCYFEKSANAVATSDKIPVAISNCNFTDITTGSTGVALVQCGSENTPIKIMNCNIINNNKAQSVFYTHHPSGNSNPLIKNCIFINMYDSNKYSEDNIIINGLS